MRLLIENNKYNIIIGNILAFLIFLISFFLLKKNPNIVNNYYSKLLYKKLIFFKNFFFNLSDFAIGEILYFSFLCCTIFYFFRNTVSINFIISSTLIVISFFYASWGINYFRPPIKRSIAKEDVITEKRIKKLTKYFSIQCNKLRKEINSKNKNKGNHLIAYKELIESENNKFKYSSISLILCYLGIKGYYNPFTNEANINSRIPEILVPITAYHELAHKQGIASESDANFIGFLNAFNSYDIEIKYSACFFAFRYLYYDLNIINPNLAQSIYSTLNNEVKKDLSTVSNFWMYYANRFQKIQRSIFDFFLKTQGQKKGIKSYNEVVWLLLSTYDGKDKFILDENY